MDRRGLAGIDNDDSPDLALDFWESMGPSHLIPEKRLAFAVVVRALADLFSRNVRTIEYIDARKWINSRSAEPWSFYWCCDAADIVPLVAERLRLAALNPNSNIDVFGFIRGSNATGLAGITKEKRERAVLNARQTSERNKTRKRTDRELKYYASQKKKR